MLSDIARAKPDGRDMTTDQWKAVFMDSCGFKATFVANLEGDGFLCLGFKSSRLSKTEFSDLIECIAEYGARHEVKWSDEPKPTSEAALRNFHRQYLEPARVSSIRKVDWGKKRVGHRSFILGDCLRHRATREQSQSSLSLPSGRVSAIARRG